MSGCKELGQLHVEGASVFEFTWGRSMMYRQAVRFTALLSGWGKEPTSILWRRLLKSQCRERLGGLLWSLPGRCISALPRSTAVLGARAGADRRPPSVLRRK